MTSKHKTIKQLKEESKELRKWAEGITKMPKYIRIPMEYLEE